MENRPRLRDSKQLTTQTIYPLNVFPKDLINRIGGYLVYLIYIGRKDISGNDWGDAFADAIGGAHLDSPVGIADVVLDKNCWSMKTVKAKDPFTSMNVYDPSRYWAIFFSKSSFDVALGLSLSTHSRPSCMQSDNRIAYCFRQFDRNRIAYLPHALRS